MNDTQQVPMKQCGKCGELKSKEMFNRDKSRKDGRQHICKECARAHIHAQRQANPDYIRIWRMENRERERLQKKAAYHRRRAQLAGAAGRGITANDIRSMQQAQRGLCTYCLRFMALYGEHLDHIIPITQGGLHDPDNACLACRKCNLNKSNRTPEQWVKRWYERDHHITENQTPDDAKNTYPAHEEVQALAARIDDILPLILAGDERDARRHQADACRRKGESLTSDEICTDLRWIMGQITQHIFVYDNGGRRLLVTPAHVLDYVERSAAYATEDYQRDFEGNSIVIALWDALDNVHTSAHTWRKSEYAGDGTAVIALIVRAVHAALNRRATPLDNALHDEGITD